MKRGGEANLIFIHAFLSLSTWQTELFSYLALSGFSGFKIAVNEITSLHHKRKKEKKKAVTKIAK